VVFSVEERGLVRERLVALARADARVVACALVGAEARGGADRWSDLDLGLGVADGAGVAEVVADWTRELVDGLGAVRLFEVTVTSSLYVVFLLGSGLQVDQVVFYAAFVDEVDTSATPLQNMLDCVVMHGVRQYGGQATSGDVAGCQAA
jgi:hypothetical protein